jgi:excisionase family DNA binding protein
MTCRDERMQVKFWYSREEAATLLSISLREIDRLIGSGTLETYRHGRRRLVLGDSLTKFARGNDQSPELSVEGDAE